MRWVALMLVLGGCDAVFQLELRDMPDAPPIDAPPVLIDVALSGHDEDGDTVDDAIDNCPGRANRDQNDSDGDDVGQVCDPNPMDPIDRLRFFSTFESFSGWTTRAGTWTAMNDTVVITGADGNELAMLDVGPFIEPTVMTTLETVVSASGQWGAGVYLVTDPAGQLELPPGLICWLVVPDNVMQMYDAGTGAFRNGSLATTTDPLEITLTAGSTTANTVPLCGGRRPDGSSVIVPTMNMLPVASAHVGLYSWLAAATFRSITVVDRVP